MTERALVFDCKGSALLGVLYSPSESDLNIGVVIVVGGPQYRVGSHRQFTLMARELAIRGFPTLRFDYRGMGDSDGEYRGFEHIGEDIRAAIDALFREQPTLHGVVLWGLCDAASAIFAYAPTDRRLLGIIAANPWARSEATLARTYVKTYYLQRIFQRTFWEKMLRGGVQVGSALRGAASYWRQSRTASQTNESGSYLDRMLRGMASFQNPILILTSGRDLTAAEFTDRCKEGAWRDAVQRANFTSEQLPNADHTFSARSDLKCVVDCCAKWLVSVEHATK